MVSIPPDVYLMASSDWSGWADTLIDGVSLAVPGTSVRTGARLDDGSLVLATEEPSEAKKGARQDRVWMGIPTR